MLSMDLYILAMMIPVAYTAQLMMYLRLSPAANIRCSCSLALARAVKIILHSGEEAPVCPLAAFTAPHTLEQADFASIAMR